MNPPSSTDEQKKNIYTENNEKENDNSSYEELQRLAAEAFGDEVHVERGKEKLKPVTIIPTQPEPIEGEIADLPKAKAKKPKREPNPDGSYGNRDVNEVRAYFLKTMGIDSEDCTRQESGQYWWNLLNSVKDGLNKVDTVKALIDLAKADRIYCTIASPKRLFFKRNELMLRLKNKSNSGVRIGVAQDTPIEHDKPQGVKIGVYYANQ